ncbi:hypothetical protein AJ79_06946 [Helicocarpus griseus UAMH5409]|uniref:Uncharacterized protein n=1 Tax=Helicocarpus griseus UAMH5409 TaxID=1447875 RepID=A0A2B7X7W1_9EURO|nr:hypothetical protein AJ79_06946 [Helicocarpus griseus UAMH5409]
MTMATRLLSEEVDAKYIRNNPLVEAILQGAKETVAMQRNDLEGISDLQDRYKYGLVCAAVAYLKPPSVLHLLGAINDPRCDELERSNNQEVALIAASITGDLLRMKDLLDSGTNIDCQDGLFGAPLSMAAFGGHLSAVKLLLDHGADWKCENHHGPSPLFYAAIAGHVSVCDQLIGAGSSANKLLLYAAAAAGQDRVVSLLMKQGIVDPNDKYRSLLLIAIKRNFPNVVEELLKHPSVDAEICELDEKKTALEIAAELGRDSIVELLLSHPSVDATSGGNGFALSYAAEGGHAGVVRLLLNVPQVNPNARPLNGRYPAYGGLTPLTRAALCGHNDVVRLLISHKDIDVNLKTTEAPGWDGWAPLGRAVKYSHSDVVATLLEHPHTQVNIEQTWGQTPLAEASQENLPEIIELLLACDCIDPNVRDFYGRGPVFYAADYRSYKAMKLLLSHPGIQAHVPDDDGSETPLMRAAAAGAYLSYTTTTEEAYGNVAQLLLNHREGEEPTEDHILGALEVAQDHEVESIERILQHALDYGYCSSAARKPSPAPDEHQE